MPARRLDGAHRIAISSHEARCAEMSGAFKNLTLADTPDGKSKYTIAAGYPRTLLEFAVRLGANRSSLLTQADLDEASIADQDNRIPLTAYVALMKAATAL